MNYVIILTITLNLAVLWGVNGVRVSSKLDFGESQSAGIRPATDIRYQKDKPLYQRENANPTTIDNIDVLCISGNCSAATIKNDSDGGISADVLVHIKTNVDVGKSKNNNTIEPIPDVPIVVGTKSTTISAIDNNRPLDIANSVRPNYPPPITTGNTFIPSVGSTFFQAAGFQADSQIRGQPSVTNYAPRFQGNVNGIDLQSHLYRPPFDNNNNNAHSSQPAWYPRRSGPGGFNPVEFKKTYDHVWTPITWTRSNPSNQERRTGLGIPRWTPCVCDNPGVQNFPVTQNYPPPNHPSGINGKLGTLI